MCNHDINKKENTIVLSKIRVMVSPEEKTGNCSECGHIFKFVKIDGKFVAV